MISFKMTREGLIQWLGDTIRTEIEKPFEEINYDLVEECGSLLDELMEDEEAFQNKSLNARVAEIEKKVNPVPVAHRKKRISWRILVAAVLVVLICLTAVLANPFTRWKFLNIFSFGQEDTVKETGVAYSNMGEEKNYASIEELMAAENLDFKYPVAEDEEFRINKIMYIDEKNMVVLCSDNNIIHYEIWIDNTDLSTYIAHATEYNFSKYKTYVVPDESSNSNKYYSYTIIDNDIHSIYADIETIEWLINSIN